MSTFDAINAAFRVILTILVIYKVTQFRDQANGVERAGLGMMGAGSFLTVPVLLYRNQNPFEGWAATLLTVGAILLLAGRTWRDRRHKKRNDMQVRGHKEWKRSRG